MLSFPPVARRLLMAATLVLSAPLVAQAEPVSLFVPYAGAGNLSVFDATAGTGGWVGSIDQVAPPVVDSPLSLVSFVLFTIDASALTLSGSFEFTTTDLLSSFFGDVSGTVSSADILSSGGLFGLDYTIRGGTGAFLDASGYGLAFVDYDPAGTFNNYAETGLLVATVPEPGTLALLVAGLAAAGASLRARRRQGQPLN
jgi:hypothetical protein